MENEVWPLIVGKALLKAFSGQPLPCGGVMLFNALTGMFPTSAPSSWLHLLQSTQHQDEAASVGKLPLPLAAFAFTSNAEQAHTFRCVVSGHLPPLLVAVVAESVSPADGEPAPSVVEDKVEDGATVESNVVHPFTSVNLLDKFVYCFSLLISILFVFANNILCVQCSIARR
jgi:hypothetical protein